MARPRALNGGKTQSFPRFVGEGLLDLRALRQEIETAEGLGERREVGAGERRRWVEYRDLLESALDVRIDLLGQSAQSHERAISGQRSSLCGVYECSEPSCSELRCLAAARRAEKAAAA